MVPFSQENGPVGQVKTAPEILLVYRAHLAMIVHNISVPNTLCSGAKKLFKVGILIALMMEASRTSETLVNFYQTTRCYNPEDSNLQRKTLFSFK
jgi:hypothetical protein